MKKIKITILVIILVALFLMVIVILANKKPAEIRIGIIAPLTGDAAIYGNPLKKGLDLATDEININGGIKGINISLIYEDSQADPSTAVSAFNKLVSINKVSAIIGDMFSQPTLAIAELAQKNKIVLLSPTASSEKVAETGDYVFSIYPSDSYDGEFLARYAIENLHKMTASVIHVQADAMITAKNAFINKYEELGGNVLDVQSYSPKMEDFRTILFKEKKIDPEIIFIPGYLEEIALLLKQAKELGINSKFITISTAYDEKIFNLASNAAQGLILSAPFYEEDNALLNSNIILFQESFKKKYNENPSVWSAYGYDALKILTNAYINGIDRKSSLHIELSKIVNYPGVTGETTFLANRKVEKQLRIFIIDNNKFIKY